MPQRPLLWSVRLPGVASVGFWGLVLQMLGHASLRTTQRYAQVDIDHLMAVYDKAHPRATLRTR